MATTITTIKKTDTMKKIQSKLNIGGQIKFEKATYKITKQLIIPESTYIDLNGSVLQRKGSIQSVFLNKCSKDSKSYKAAGNITIYNGTIEGMGGYEPDNLITFFHSHDIIIHHITFKDILCHGIELNSSTRVMIYNCKFLGFNLIDKEYSCKENIQIDHAGYTGFVVSGSSKKSACYDGTCCNDIEIFNCEFNKSAYRDYPYACIGQHSQLSGAIFKHRNIKIYNNKFYCKKNPELIQACLSFTSMENVTVCNNYFDCSRVARIYSKNYSYTTKGVKVDAKSGDGICSNIVIKDNQISGCKTSKEAFQQYNKSGEQNHSYIVKSGNKYV